MSQGAAKILSTGEIEYFKEKGEMALSKKGVIIDNHPEALQLLKKAGAEVSSSDNWVKFPRPLIEDALRQVPREFLLAAIDPKNDMPVPHPKGLFYGRAGSGQMYLLTETPDHHLITMEDVAELTRLANALENIDICALPSTSPSDFPAETIDIHTLNTVFRNSAKHYFLQPYELKNISYLIEMAAAVVGGKEELRKRPIISLPSNCAFPLGFKPMDLEALIQCARHGIPIHAGALPTAGVSAPITPQGIALLFTIETLAQIVIAQLFAPGTPCFAKPLLFEMDMRTTSSTMCAISTTMAKMAAIQVFGDGYGIPSHTYGTGTESLTVDAQAGIESSSVAHMLSLAGVTLLGGAGQIETAKTISPQQMIIDNDLFGMLKKLKAGLEINDEIAALGEIMDLKGKDSFIEMDHTYRHFREAYQSRTFTNDSWDSWNTKGRKDIFSRATDAYHDIAKNYEAITLPDEVLSELDAIVKRADDELGRKR